MPSGNRVFTARIEIESGIYPLRHKKRYARPNRLTPVFQRPKPGYVLRVAWKKARLTARKTLITNAIMSINLIGPDLFSFWVLAV
jgi:hypothetical protein